MSINANTVNQASINTFGGRTRKIIFDRLVDQKVSQIGGHSQARSSMGAKRPFNQMPSYDVEDKPTLSFEQPIVSVTVEFLGTVGTDSQEVLGAQVDFVTVTNFEVTSIQPAAINISDFNIE